MLETTKPGSVAATWPLSFGWPLTSKVSLDRGSSVSSRESSVPFCSDPFVPNQLGSLSYIAQSMPTLASPTGDSAKRPQVVEREHVGVAKEEKASASRESCLGCCLAPFCFFETTERQFTRRDQFSKKTILNETHRLGTVSFEPCGISGLFDPAGCTVNR